MCKVKFITAFLFLFCFFSYSDQTGDVKTKKTLNSNSTENQQNEKTIDDLIVDRTFFVLIREYDNIKDKTATEKIVIKLGRSAYVDSLTNWKNNYKNLDTMKIKLHYIFEYMAKRGEKTLEPKDAEYFRKLLENLSLLGYKNINLYYLSIAEYLKANNKSYYDFNLDLLGEAIATVKYYKLKKEIYKDEQHTRNEVGRMLNETKLKYRLPIYTFAFNYFNKIRQDIVDTELKDILKKLKEKKLIKESDIL